MVNFFSFRGNVTEIHNLTYSNGEMDGCVKMMSVRGANDSIVNFVVSPDSYFAEQALVVVGDDVTGYYDRNAPAILIYPPQYPALVVTKYDPILNFKVAYFDDQLISSDGQLKLNLGQNTQILLANNQPFVGNPRNRNLVVSYGISTRSIPAQTTPGKIVVWCG